MLNNKLPGCLTLLASLALGAQPAAADEAADLAKKLANPISNLISAPLQLNYNENFGEDEEGSVWKLTIQPVIPISISEDWNVVSRTILPIISQSDIPTSGEGESGIGDTVQSLFFSPKAPTDNGWIWGAGPVFLLDTASDDALGSEQWGIGPTAVVLKQTGPWTYGALVNHIESVSGNDDRDDVSSTFLQPFLTYITSTKTTFSINTESTYDWEHEQWSIPINLTVNQMLKAGDQLFQVGGGVRYWADSPDLAADDWGLRLQLTFLFPK